MRPSIGKLHVACIGQPSGSVLSQLVVEVSDQLIGELSAHEVGHEVAIALP